MKKLFVFLAIVISMLAFNVCHAAYPTHLNGDPNYVLCDGHMGTGWFLQKDSVELDGSNEREAVLSFSLVTVNNLDKGNAEVSARRNIKIGYDLDRIKMYYINDNSVRYLDPDGPLSMTRIYMPAGEIAFYVFFQNKFYGLVNNHFGDKVFSEAFYNQI